MFSYFLTREEDFMTSITNILNSNTALPETFIIPKAFGNYKFSMVQKQSELYEIVANFVMNPGKDVEGKSYTFQHIQYIASESASLPFKSANCNEVIKT